MTRCVRQSRWQELHPLAHKLKSSVTMLGMEALTPLVLEIERISKFGRDPSALPELVSRLTLELETVTRALDNDLTEACGPIRSGPVRLRRA
jgi:HPt (histidine-containing phosphotransfer) domain-containing protein